MTTTTTETDRPAADADALSALLAPYTVTPRTAALIRAQRRERSRIRAARRAAQP